MKYEEENSHVEVVNWVSCNIIDGAPSTHQAHQIKNKLFITQCSHQTILIYSIKTLYLGSFSTHPASTTFGTWNKYNDL